MAEYIDREKIFPNGVFYVSAENPESSLTELINRICNLPTADVVPNQAYEDGYEQGVRDFAKRIRERDRTWSISEIEKELLGENVDRDTV